MCHKATGLSCAFCVQARTIAYGVRQMGGAVGRGKPCSSPHVITLFDYVKGGASAFGGLVAVLPESAEWKFVDRKFDIRLRRDRT